MLYTVKRNSDSSFPPFVFIHNLKIIVIFQKDSTIEIRGTMKVHHQKMRKLTALHVVHLLHRYLMYKSYEFLNRFNSKKLSHSFITKVYIIVSIIHLKSDQYETGQKIFVHVFLIHVDIPDNKIH